MDTPEVFAQVLIDDAINSLIRTIVPLSVGDICTCFEGGEGTGHRYSRPFCATLESRTYTFASAIVFRSVVTRGWSCEMAGDELQQLDEAVDSFQVHRRSLGEQQSTHDSTAPQGNVHIAYAFVNTCLRTLPTSSELSSLPRVPDVEDEVELALFGGRT
ncbi:hypothetical protein BD410DRAFT_844827 [Rickenella mellea]|uniref:Uncharacterized protein n=1 Tax=Rickenella mellea TaxID=50990 RepID=A0A4Y7PK71_9AGAM|nr:hypothetical protein BD410DRAFT_844827 [Rickenella mellea]